MAPVRQTNTIFHFTHPAHRLSLVNAAEYRCEGCKTTGTGTRFRCEPCNFDLHEYCATCPTFLSSFMHPHPLNMVQRKPQSMRRIERVCNVCRDEVEGLFYRCKDCEFNVHPLCIHGCGVPFGSGVSSVNPPRQQVPPSVNPPLPRPPRLVNPPRPPPSVNPPRPRPQLPSVNPPRPRPRPSLNPPRPRPPPLHVGGYGYGYGYDFSNMAQPPMPAPAYGGWGTGQIDASPAYSGYGYGVPSGFGVYNNFANQVNGSGEDISEDVYEEIYDDDYEDPDISGYGYGVPSVPSGSGVYSNFANQVNWSGENISEDVYEGIYDEDYEDPDIPVYSYDNDDIAFDGIDYDEDDGCY